MGNRGIENWYFLIRRYSNIYIAKVFDIGGDNYWDVFKASVQIHHFKDMMFARGISDPDCPAKRPRHWPGINFYGHIATGVRAQISSTIACLAGISTASKVNGLV